MLLLLEFAKDLLPERGSEPWTASPVQPLPSLRRLIEIGVRKILRR